MAIMPDTSPDEGDQKPLGVRLGWFFGLSLASLAATAALAYTLRALLFLG